jgi:Flp pilus assembly protein TadD
MDHSLARACFLEGTALLKQGRYGEAETYLREAVRHWPDHAGSLNNLGTAVWQQGRVEEAEPHYRRALALEPNDFGILNNLGNALWEQGRPDEAVTYYHRALEHNPDVPETMMNLGVALSDQGNYEEALTWIRASLQRHPDSPEALDNLGMTLARQGNWDKALACYEWRMRCRNYHGLILNRPRWTGQTLPDRSILLHAEQGLGDALQFIRFAALVKQRSGRVLVAAPSPLLRLLARFPGVDQVVDWQSAIPDHDLQAPLMSLPAILGTTLDNLPAVVPYLSADSPTIELWRKVVEQSLNRALGGAAQSPTTPRRELRIGIAWQGNPRNRVDRSRSFPLRHFEHLARLPGVCLISLQKDHGLEQLRDLDGRFPVTELDGHPHSVEHDRDLLDTAAVMSHLDLVVTPESAVAHLAGSLGVPVWVALSAAGDWRWMIDREDSPWYPTMRLFRQPTPGDWDSVFQRMAQTLSREGAFPRAKNLSRCTDQQQNETP